MTCCLTPAFGSLFRLVIFDGSKLGTRRVSSEGQAGDCELMAYSGGCAGWADEPIEVQNAVRKIKLYSRSTKSKTTPVARSDSADSLVSAAALSLLTLFKTCTAPLQSVLSTCGAHILSLPTFRSDMTGEWRWRWWLLGKSPGNSLRLE